MNCSLCKYRAQVLGFEQEVGLDQSSHHHHVEGLTEACDLCERECTGACSPDGVPIPLGGGHHHAMTTAMGLTTAMGPTTAMPRITATVITHTRTLSTPSVRPPCARQSHKTTHLSLKPEAIG